MEFLGEYKKIQGEMSQELARVEQALAGGMDADYFDNHKSRLHAHLKQALGGAAADYLLVREGERPLSRYELALQPGQIRFARVPPPGQGR